AAIHAVLFPPFGGLFSIFQSRRNPIFRAHSNKIHAASSDAFKSRRERRRTEKLIEFLRPEETDVMKGLNNLRQQIFLLRRVLRQSDCPEGKYIVPKDSRYYFSLEYSLETDTGQLDQLAYRIRNETMDEEEKKQ